MDSLPPTSSLRAGEDPTSTLTGVVTGRPRVWLRIEGTALLVAGLVAYAHTGQTWWLLALTLLLPDLGALGYLLSRRAGALFYNTAHATPIPLALLGLGLWQGTTLTVALALVWLIHIGMDRAMAYGFKHDDSPNHTHLGWHGHPPSS